MLIKVRITRISSFKSPDGRIGRQIEFTEEQRIRQPVFASTEADQAQMAGDIAALMGPLLKGFQGMFPIVMPRMSIWLLEEEIEELGIPLEVNKTYNMDITGGRITLQPIEKEE
nr:arcadin 1 [Candidatus Njordarchaeota archaeon]